MTRLLVIQHVPHEGLGAFADVFTRAGCTLVPLHAADPQTAWPRAASLDGVVILGGPMSVYERHRHPFLTTELHFLRNALQEDLPLLGICLGAQLVAHALDAPVIKNPHKEIGWYPLRRATGAEEDPLLAPFAREEQVFQWHGDTFALPRGAVRLAGSPLCTQQAFRYGRHVYGLQFHVEVTAAIIDAWLQVPENAQEVCALRGTIDPDVIRRQTPQHLPRLQALAEHVATTFGELVASRKKDVR